MTMKKSGIQNRILNPLITRKSTSSAISSVLPRIRTKDNLMVSLPLLNTSSSFMPKNDMRNDSGRFSRVESSRGRTRSISPASISSRNLRPMSYLRKLRQRPSCSTSKRERSTGSKASLPVWQSQRSVRKLSPSSVRSLPSTRSLRQLANRRCPLLDTPLTPDPLSLRQRGKDLKEASYWSFSRAHEGIDATKQPECRKVTTTTSLPLMNDRMTVKGDIARNKSERIHFEAVTKKKKKDLSNEHPRNKSSVPASLSHEEMIAARTKIFSEIRLTPRRIKDGRNFDDRTKQLLIDIQEQGGIQINI